MGLLILMTTMTLPQKTFPNPMTTLLSSIFGEWGHEGVCFRKQQGNQNIHAKLNVALDPNVDDPNL